MDIEAKLVILFGIRISSDEAFDELSDLLEKFDMPERLKKVFTLKEPYSVNRKTYDESDIVGFAVDNFGEFSGAVAYCGSCFIKPMSFFPEEDLNILQNFFKECTIKKPEYIIHLSSEV